MRLANAGMLSDKTIKFKTHMTQIPQPDAIGG
jgi:hypothetical protein